MALIVPGDRSFVIIPKHSNLPLAPTHHQKHPGNTIQQQEPYTNNPAQQFQLKKKGTGEYHVYLPYDNLYWAIAGVSPDTGANLIQWHMQDSGDQVSPNQRFRFMYAGDGYYYLRPVHARGRVLEVTGATHGQDTIRQGDLAPVSARDHQLFRVVPVSADYLSNEVRTFHKHSDQLRDLVLGVTGLIPTIGGGAKAALGVFWPDGHDQDFWNQMTQYVEQRMKQLLLQENMLKLHGHLAGIRKKTKQFLNTTEVDVKGTRLIAAISEATGDEYDFLRDREGVTVLPLLAAWGTLVLTLRAELVQGYETLFPDKTAEHKAAGKAEELGFLREEIEEYVAGVAHSRQRALEWRLSHIKQGSSESSRDFDSGNITVTEFYRKDWVVDEYDGWRMDRGNTTYSYRPDVAGDPNSQANITAARLARQAQVRAQFNAELDALLAPAYLWPYMDPSKPTKPAALPVNVAVGPFGVRPGGTAFDIQPGGLRKVVICWGDGHSFICGLKLTYADNVERTYGVAGSQQAKLDLAMGEYIVNARGYEWDQVEGLLLETNHGRLCEGGRMGGGTFFEAGLDDAVNARLVGISGTYQGNLLNTLTFHWKYTLQK
ncbi:RICIN domain-containing protein [Hymenobacter sp. 15J16-1T3B]|uniref:RICIN domain-containing protein n=1 Tax=Hymenobacter sp. 15J16-1T3B TaxID=2886941 RepID=UPI001D12D892|nr:RICIN domain-containing protein [Hymenobacter sp. 15J16-1T3B]MCC3158275.1 RICIN domain-containing protein [Hymenobacter sp. 15J16-1T3B]